MSVRKESCTNARDEREVNNATTTLLRRSDLKGRYVKEASDEFATMIVPVGVNVILKRYLYPVKVKPGKIKPISPDITEDALIEGSEHFNFLQSNSEVSGKKWEFVVEVIAGHHYLSVHEEGDGAFGDSKEEVEKREVLEILSVRPR